MTQAMLDLELARWSVDKVMVYMQTRNVRRKHLMARGVLTSRIYDRWRKSEYQPNEFQRWLVDLWRVFSEVNAVVFAPPEMGSKIVQSAEVSWADFFAEWKNFPKPPGRGSADPTTQPGPMLDSGASGFRDLNPSRVAGMSEELWVQLQRWRGFGDQSKQRQLLEKLAQLNESVTDWASAVPLLQELREINSRFGDKVFTADASLRLGIAFYRLKKWPESKTAIQQGLEQVSHHSKILGNSKTNLRLLGYSGLLQLRTDNPRGALLTFNKQVYPLVALHDCAFISATFHHRRAIVHSALKMHGEAREDFAAALKLRIGCSAEVEATRTLYFLGETCALQNFPKAAVAIWKICDKRQAMHDDAYGRSRTKLKLAHEYLRLSQRRNTAGSRVTFELDEAGLSPGLLESISKLANGVNEKDAGALSFKLRSEQLEDLALDCFTQCSALGERCNDDGMVQAGRSGLERIAR